MTYTIFECLKEKFNELLEDQTENSVAAIITDVEKISVDAQVLRIYVGIFMKLIESYFTSRLFF